MKISDFELHGEYRRPHWREGFYVSRSNDNCPLQLLSPGHDNSYRKIESFTPTYQDIVSDDWVKMSSVNGGVIF